MMNNNLSIAACVEHAACIEGWMELDELAWLAQTAAHSSTIVEIGSWKGRSTKALALATPGVVYAVDTWKGSPSEYGDNHAEALKLGQGGLFAVFHSNLRDEIRCGKVVPIIADSGEAIPFLKQLLTPRGMADMIFIDGDHSYTAVMDDIRNYHPLLAPGGVFCGHDYHDTHPGVKAAVNESVAPVQVAGRSIWYRQNEVLTGMWGGGR